MHAGTAMHCTFHNSLSICPQYELQNATVDLSERHEIELVCLLEQQGWAATVWKGRTGKHAPSPYSVGQPTMFYVLSSATNFNALYLQCLLKAT